MPDDHDIVLMAVMLSDSAIREMGTAKVSYIGCFHQYQSAVFPFAVPPFVITPFLTNIRGKLEKPLTVAVRIEDPRTGIVLGNMGGNLAMQMDYTFTGTEVMEIPFPIQQMFFPAAGKYTVVVMVNGEKIGERPLHVISISATPQIPNR